MAQPKIPELLVAVLYSIHVRAKRADANGGRGTLHNAVVHGS
jgi:hypothetical protein